jgi:hypothetical protein
MSRRWLATALLAVAALATSSLATPPTYLGKLRIDRKSRGHVDPNTGNAAFVVKGWTLLPAPGSNGIDPAHEVIDIAMGDSENFLIPAGKMKSSKNGKRFWYTDKTDRGVRSIHLVLNPDGSFRVKFSLAGADFSRLLLLNRPATDCVPVAIIIGDDDGFAGVTFELPKLSPLSGLLMIPGSCDNVASWPWA